MKRAWVLITEDPNVAGMRDDEVAGAVTLPGGYVVTIHADLEAVLAHIRKQSPESDSHYYELGMR